MIEFGFDASKIDVLPSYIDTSSCTPSTSAGDYALYFGRLSNEKGVDNFYEAASMNPNIPHTGVGAGPEEAALKRLTDLLSLQNVSFYGFKTGDALKQLIHQWMVVVPSR